MTTVCIRSSSETLTLYFYGELAPTERAEFDAHLGACADCRAALGELQLVGELLSDRAAPVRSPREWGTFMRRLDLALDAGLFSARDVARGTHTARSTLRLARSLHVARRTLHVKGLAIAATLLLAVALGLVWQMRVVREHPVPIETAPSTSSGPSTRVMGDDALHAAAMKHFERAKLVVLGLAMKDPASARPGDWRYERELASSLLPDTRLYRQFAVAAGDTKLSDVLGDLETVLLQAAMTSDADAPELQRLQRLIRRRDLLERMDADAASASMSVRGI